LSRYYYCIPLFITNIFPDFSETILNYTHSSFETQRNLHNGFFETFRGNARLEGAVLCSVVCGSNRMRTIE